MEQSKSEETTWSTPAYNIKVLDEGYVQIADPTEDVMGSDLKTVNAARASFANASFRLDNRDEKLIRYLGTNNHTSPFRHSAISFRVKLPLFVAAQWRTHMVASALQSEIHSFNEASARYIEMKDEFYFPTVWRKQAQNNRQASGSNCNKEENEFLDSIARSSVASSRRSYEVALKNGAARELARILLPQSLYTTFMWTASLQAIAHFIELRDSEHAQWEIRQYAAAVREVAEELFPHSLAALLAPKPPTIEQLKLADSMYLVQELINRGYDVSKDTI